MHAVSTAQKEDAEQKTSLFPVEKYRLSNYPPRLVFLSFIFRPFPIEILQHASVCVCARKTGTDKFFSEGLLPLAAGSQHLSHAHLIPRAAARSPQGSGTPSLL
jgi:hypothetical protein